MQRSLRPLRLVFVVATAFAIEAACDDEELSNDLGPSLDGGFTAISGDAASAVDAAASPISTMRLAHLAPELGAVDFCYQAARAGTFVGPVLGGGTLPKDDAGDQDDAGDDAGDDAAADAGPNDADAPGLRSASYRTVSRYLNLVASGPIRIAIVEAGTGSCANPLVTSDVTLDPDKLSTVALFARRDDGGADGTLEVAAFTDDRTTAAEKVRVRVVHAARGKTTIAAAGPIAVAAVASRTTVLADCVEPRKPSTPSPSVSVDALGYVTSAPMPAPVAIAIAPATTEAGVDAGFAPWQSQGKDLALHGGSLHTAFVLTGSSTGTFEVLWCADMTTSGDQTQCEIVR